MGRFFTYLQKDKLYLKTNGNCAICGQNLDEDWQADHIIPYSKGGKTEIENGQAVCKICNLKKGDKLVMKLRVWQQKFLQTYLKSQQQSFLMVATPGAGKTFATLTAIKNKIEEQKIEKIIIVVPSEQLKFQWASEAFDKFRIQLNPLYKSNTIGRDFDGICLTYGKVINSWEMLDNICKVNKVLVVLDEIHHAGESKMWGDSIQSAFYNAALVLALSGTPFRSDNNKIPFVQYDKNRVAISQFNYGYGDAIRDGVCRSLLFFNNDGSSEFYHNSEHEVINSFGDIEDEEMEAVFLKSLLDTDGEYLRNLLEAADNKLNDIREEDNDAGGLVVTMDTGHANRVGKLLSKITGENVTVIHSDIDNPKAKIEKFTESNDKWLVAVKMISEGIDIKRLRVGVYATNVLQELTFRQIVGRVVRRKNDFDDWAYFYVPQAPRLVKIMSSIKQEVLHAIKDIIKLEREIGDKNIQHKLNELVTISTGRNEQEDIIIANEDIYNRKILDMYKENLEDILGKNLNEWQIGQAVSILQKIESNLAIKERNNIFPTLKANYVEKPELSKACHKAVQKLAGKLKYAYNASKDYSEIVKAIHNHWGDLGNSYNQQQAEIEELKRKLEWLGSGDILRNYERYI